MSYCTGPYAPNAFVEEKFVSGAVNTKLMIMKQHYMFFAVLVQLVIINYYLAEVQLCRLYNYSTNFKLF